MANKNYFNRHLFRKVLSCPAKLYYAAHEEIYPPVHPGRLLNEHNNRMRKKLELLARVQYPNGKLITSEDSAYSIDKTKELLRQESVTIYNAVLLRNHCMGRIPVLYKEGKKVVLLMAELKRSKSLQIPDKNVKKYARSRWKKYLAEMAYLKWLASAYFDKSHVQCRLVLPDGNAKNEVLNAYQKLVIRDQNSYLLSKSTVGEFQAAPSLVVNIEVTSIVDEMFDKPELPVKTDTVLDDFKFGELMEFVLQNWENDKKITPPTDRRCSTCEYYVPDHLLTATQESGFDECWRPFTNNSDHPCDRYHILSLAGHGKQQFIQQGIYDLKQIDLNELNTDGKNISKKPGAISLAERQYLQIKKSKKDLETEEFIKPELFEEIGRWPYPLHFVDFEAATLPVPIRNGGIPYETLVFQFSCHTFRENGELKHFEWLDTTPGSFPNYHFVRSFLKIPDIEEGTLVQFSPFEKQAFIKVKKQLKREYDPPSDREELVAGLQRLVSRPDSRKKYGPYFADMHRIIKNYYYNRYMDGAMGLKSTLSSVFKSSSVLKEIYQKPYNGTNFKDQVWWNRNAETGIVISPYQLLENEITDGSEAFAVYGLLQEHTLTDAERQRMKISLKKYCELDTLGLLMIYQHWKHGMLNH